jgi:NAD+ synthetase
MAAPNFIIAQINQKVGDIEGNVARVVSAAKPHRTNADAIVIFPELTIIGYPPEDLVLRPAFVEQSIIAIHQLATLTEHDLPALIVGGLWQEHNLLYNAAFLLADGKIQHIHKKSMLPNYGIFDEKRLFAHGSTPLATTFRGHKIGILICEDAWHTHNARLLAAQGTEYIVVINASPFELGKPIKRHEIIQQVAQMHRIPTIYVNLIGGQDDIVFDGASFAYDASGTLIYQAPAFAKTVQPLANTLHEQPEKHQEIWQALCLGLHDYVKKNSFNKVLLGLSGGIDSAVVAAIAKDALGAENVLACLLPSEFTSDASNADAMECANLLGIQTVSLPIARSVDALESHLIPSLKTLGVNIANWRTNLNIGGNVQSRLRGLYLMTLSNALGALLLNTSNKSEIAVGYSTLYGDSCGAFAPIKDVYKTQIYQLAKWRNKQETLVIPISIVSKPPTAELAPNQKDSDQLPEYDVLDAILERMIEKRQDVQEIVANGFDKKTVEKISKLLSQSEYKRRQSPPGTKISTMQFNRDWRYPLTK